MQEEIYKRLHASKLGPCDCSQARRFARKLSSLYDALLSPEDLTITQYSLLADIERAGQLSHAVLAEKVGMDRTTLTRNLRPLTRAKWVTAETGEDRRQRWLQLTAAGRRKLLRSLLWQFGQTPASPPRTLRISPFACLQNGQRRGLGIPRQFLYSRYWYPVGAIPNASGNRGSRSLSTKLRIPAAEHPL